MIAPTACAQHRPLVLTIAPGKDGYRLAYVGGGDFKVIIDGLTWDHATWLYRQAIAGVAGLMETAK